MIKDCVLWVIQVCCAATHLASSPEGHSYQGLSGYSQYCYNLPDCVYVDRSHPLQINTFLDTHQKWRKKKKDNLWHSTFAGPIKGWTAGKRLVTSSPLPTSSLPSSSSWDFYAHCTMSPAPPPLCLVPHKLPPHLMQSLEK